MTDFLSPTTTMQPAGTRRARAWWLVYIPLIILFVFAVAPLLLAWFTALKTDQQQLVSPYGPPLPPTLDNLREAWTVGRFSIYFKNSIIIPLYLTMRDFRLLDTYGSVIIADVALAAPIFVFIMRAFFRDLPRELDDAARVDGANEFQIFWKVMLPLAKPGLMTVALLEFLWSWNDLLLPLVFLVTNDLRTLPVGMLFFQGQFTIDYGLMSAGVLIISLPVTILFLIFQRDFVRGLASGALKG